MVKKKKKQVLTPETVVEDGSENLDKKTNRFIFFDVNPDIIEIYKMHLSKFPQFSFITERCDCRKIIQVRKIDAIVSPANSLGLMDGGIDLYFCKMFPGIQRTVQTAFRKYRYETRKGFILPVGSAIVVPTNHLHCPWLISAPTMPEPTPIPETRNVYKCFTAILHCLVGYQGLVIAVPGLGTHCGKMDPETSALQILEAMEDFLNEIPVENVSTHTKGEFVVFPQQ